MGDNNNDVVVAMVPFPGQGHLNQLLHLSRLILSYKIPVHYIGNSTHNRQAKHRVHGFDPDAEKMIHFHDLEIPAFDSPPPDPKDKFPTHLQHLFDVSTQHPRGSVADLLRTLACDARKLIVIYDSLMGSVIQDAQFIPNAETYSFKSVSVFSYVVYKLETLRELKIKDDSSLMIRNEIPPYQECISEDFSEFIIKQHAVNINFVSGMIHNTSRVIEETHMNYLKELDSFKHWALGPFNPVTIPKYNLSDPRHHCLEWLDKKPPNSVVYIAFGSTSTHSDEQIKEIAFGLKRSDKNFIWVLREADRGDIFSGEARKAELPEGYEESVKEKGVIIRDWAPQLEILGNPSIGGFVSHCGWNSCMESISMGVPIGAWPMHSDQPSNTVLITEVLKVGIVVRKWKDRNEILSASDVESRVKMLMEGEEVRKRAAEIGRKVRESVAQGGEAQAEFHDFIAHITGQIRGGSMYKAKARI